MARFENALADNPAPRRLGDIVLRYESSMLIGETPRARRSAKPTVAWAMGLSALVATLGTFVARAPIGLTALLLCLGALGLAVATRLEILERRSRRFVMNFATTSLRLDFVTPFVGHPKTLVVPFDAVRAVGLSGQADGAWCLTVDFEPSQRSPGLFREVLAAFILPDELEQAHRLRRVLEGAFGLGTPPHDSPANEGQGEHEPTQ